MRSKADVEVTSFLSGGLDSTSIIKMQKQLGLNINSFLWILNKNMMNNLV